MDQVRESRALQNLKSVLGRLSKDLSDMGFYDVFNKNNLIKEDWEDSHPTEESIKEYLKDHDPDNDPLINWKLISKHMLSEDFIRKYEHKYDWSNAHANLNVNLLSDKFCEEFDSKLRKTPNSEFSNPDLYKEAWVFNFPNVIYHRTLGPAVVYLDGKEEYWHRGEHLKYIHSMEQYQRWLNLRAFI